MNTDNHVPMVPPKILNLDFKVWYRPSDLIEMDTTCDSKCMNDAMQRVDVAMRTKFCWALMSTYLQLVMNNDGRHSTDQYILNFTMMNLELT